MSIKNGILSSMCLAAGGLVLVAILGFLFGLMEDGPDKFVPLITLLSTLGLALLVSIIIVSLGKIDIKSFVVNEMRLGENPNYAQLLGYVIGGLVLSVVGSSFMVWTASNIGAESLVPTVDYANIVFRGPFLLLSIISLAVLVPISEEIFFRSYLYKNFHRLGIVAKIALSSGIFALFHAGQLEIIVILSTFFTGAILGFVYHKFRSVTPCILIHAGQNLLVIGITVILN